MSENEKSIKNMGQEGQGENLNAKRYEKLKK
jgi:hypothetical protein